MFEKSWSPLFLWAHGETHAQIWTLFITTKIQEIQVTCTLISQYDHWGWILPCSALEQVDFDVCKGTPATGYLHGTRSGQNSCTGRSNFRSVKLLFRKSSSQHTPHANWIDKLNWRLPRSKVVFNSNMFCSQKKTGPKKYPKEVLGILGIQWVTGRPFMCPEAGYYKMCVDAWSSLRTLLSNPFNFRSLWDLLMFWSTTNYPMLSNVYGCFKCLWTAVREISQLGKTINTMRCSAFLRQVPTWLESRFLLKSLFLLLNSPATGTSPT